MLIISLLFLGYSLLSWVLFFRDERALSVLGEVFYPSLNDFFWQARSFLLEVFKLNTIPTLLFAFLLGLLFILYFKNLDQANKLKIILFGTLFQIIVFFSYPVLSTDILSYILSDRIVTVYQQNVWTTKPERFKNDKFYGLADWTDQTRIYGGVNQFIYTPITKLSGDDFLANLASHKFVVMVFAIATMILIPSAMVFWNPLFVIETVGSGHNDIVMLFFTVAGLKLFNRNKFFLSGILLGIATQVKTVPLILIFYLIMKLISEVKIKQLLSLTIPFTVTVFVIYYFMGVNPLDTISRTAGSINVYWQSLPMQLNYYLPVLKPISTLVLVVTLIVQTMRSLIFRLNPIEVFVQFMLIYLLFVLAAFWNWYPIWLLVLLPLLPQDSKTKAYVLALTVSSMFGYVAYWVSLRFNYQFFLWPVIIYLTVLFGPLWIFLKNTIKK